MSLTTEVKKVEAEFDKLIDKIKALFEGHANVYAAVAHINEAKDAATVPAPAPTPTPEAAQVEPSSPSSPSTAS
jgi:hypothetical protein